MALKLWLIRKIEQAELELKNLNALLIMLSHVEKADDYSDSDSDGDSIRACDIRLVEVDTDSDEDDE
jgi:hypothetical protein